MHAVIESTDNQFHLYWNKLVESDPGQNPLYAPALGATGWNESRCENYQDHSFMVVADQEPVFGCSLTSTTDTNGLRRLGFYGREASTLMNRKQMGTPSNNFEPEAIRLLMDHFDRLMCEISPDVLDYLDPVSCGLMSPLTQILLEKGALPQVHNSQLIRLALSERALLNRVDEQFRHKINWGSEHIAMTVVAGDAIEDSIAPLSQLCAKYCSGSDASVELQRSCEVLVRNQQGFLIQTALESQDRALFVHNRHTCHLVVADVPGHTDALPVLQTLIWQAIRFSKQLDCEYFDLGGRILQSVPVDLKKFGGTAHARIRVSYSQ